MCYCGLLLMLVWLLTLLCGCVTILFVRLFVVRVSVALRVSVAVNFVTMGFVLVIVS